MNFFTQSYFLYRLFISLSLILITNYISATYANNTNNNSKPKTKIIEAVKAVEAPKIDGVLDDAVWQNIQPVSDFSTFEPDVGKTPNQKTEVRITYDNIAVYIGAYMYDETPDKILKEMGLRDTWNINADYFGVCFDTYNDKQNGFGFYLTASGVQNDAKYSSNGEDGNWDAVWQSAVSITDKGWIAEIKIPYSAIRFPEAEIQDWGLGFMRQIRRIRERSMWNDFDPAQDGYVNQFGTFSGLKGIEPPVRLSLTPYVTGIYKRFEGDGNFSARGGMDVKYGLNESFTLDMILVPDFSQVQSDDQVLNLSPFEVRFDENRPFFTEGTELFNRAGIFYSRRVGATPIHYYNVESELQDGEKIIKNSQETQLYNATKISGRTPKGLGVGFFNAITGNTYATIRDTTLESNNERQFLTDPVTNYNIVVLDQSLKNSSYVSLINTNVMRAGKDRDANVTATDFKFSNQKQSIAVGGKAILTQIFDKEVSDKAELGFKTDYYIEKSSGNFKIGFWQNIESDTYNPNDLGFLFNNNEFSNGIYGSYRTFEPKGILVNTFNFFNLNLSHLYEPFDFQNFNFNANHGVTFKNWLTVGINYNVEPVKGNDFFEPRQEGRFSVVPENFNMGGFISSDYRKKVAIDIDGGFARSPFYEEKGYWWGFSPRIRFSDRFSIIHRTNFSRFPREVGYATIPDDTEDVIYGFRDRQTVINTLTSKYIFTPRMALNLRLRHYWSKVAYEQFKFLQTDGYLTDTDYTGDHNNSFNAFTLDFVYTWEFTLGSELSFVWKNAIFQNDDLTDDNFFDNLNKTFDSSATNTFSLRVLYFLDYLTFKRK